MLRMHGLVPPFITDLIERCQKAQQSAIQWVNVQYDVRCTVPFMSVAPIYKDIAHNIRAFAKRWANGLPQVHRLQFQLCSPDPELERIDALMRPDDWPIDLDVTMGEEMLTEVPLARCMRHSSEGTLEAENSPQPQTASGSKKCGQVSLKRKVDNEEAKVKPYSKQRRLLRASAALVTEE
jgi:hypothetical protein